MYKKNEQFYFIHISVLIKATEMVFIWEDKGYPIVCFVYKMKSEQCTVAEIYANLFGALVS